MNEHALARSYAGGVDKRLPRHEPGKWYRRGADMIDARRLARELPRRRHDILRERASRPRKPWHAEHGVADGEPGHPSTDLSTTPETSQPATNGGREKLSAGARTDADIDGVQTGGANADEHLRRQRMRPRDVRRRQSVGSPKPPIMIALITPTPPAPQPAPPQPPPSAPQPAWRRQRQCGVYRRCDASRPRIHVARGTGVGGPPRPRLDQRAHHDGGSSTTAGSRSAGARRARWKRSRTR